LAVEPITVVRGTALPLRGDDIDTDRIIPARFLKSITFDGLERHLFEDDRLALDAGAPRRHPVSNPAFATATILLVSANFGCGSSREHAPQAILRRGIRAIVGQSYSEIFYGNAVTIGLPCVTAPADVLAALMNAVERAPSTILTLDLESMTVRLDEAPFAVTLPRGAREAFLDGTWDATGLLLEHFEQVRDHAARLPYVSGRW
jgi:3-isopropylmalate/(R)-2-methylmalate dehydratase small subunit